MLVPQVNGLGIYVEGRPLGRKYDDPWKRFPLPYSRIFFVNAFWILLSYLFFCFLWIMRLRDLLVNALKIENA